MTVIEIPIRLPGLNEYTAENRRNRYAGAKMKADIETMLISYITAQRPPKHDRVHVTFRWREPNKKRDPDNISGFGHKVIFDSLVKAGVIPNDGWNNISGYSDCFEVSKQPGVRIDIVEVKNE